MKFTVNGYNFVAKTSTFPGGEEYVNIGKSRLPKEPEIVVVHALISSSSELMKLLLLTEALRHYAPAAAFSLDLGYLPYARQDNRFDEGESYSIKVVADLINYMGYDRVTIVDCHSSVGLALINNVRHISQLKGICMTKNLSNLAEGADVIVAPDAGAAKKAQEIATHFRKPLVQCLKTRTPDGRIEVQVLGDVTGLNALVVDDICDGGGTFLALAESELSKAKELNLYVTHGIFSKGTQELEDHYTAIGSLYHWNSHETEGLILNV
jgi:ribose-phosphate pyrophosphokinase